MGELSPALSLHEVLSKVHLFPVRHHSPRTSHALERFLHQVKPKLVLVEGPHDADTAIEVLLDEQTKPPVAILGYRTDGEPGSSLFPFATYSPEYVALKWAKENGVEARFIDISCGQGLAVERGRAMQAPEAPAEEEPADAEERTDADEGDAHVVNASHELALARGFRSFEELWEACFEAPVYEPSSFRALLLAWADIVRDEPDRLSFHRARDAFMAARIAEYAQKTAPETIAVVVGAAHAAAFVANDIDSSLERSFEASVPTSVTLIPYSFTRLAEQTGYGAGNRAPHYYQRAYDAGCDFRRATLEVLVDFTEHLRLRGFTASLADTIEAYRLACTLADIRGKSQPGLDEVREASVATMCRGDATHIDGFLWPSVIGHAIGKVASRIGRNSLQQEFWREVEARRLPKTDSPERFTLKLNEPVQVETSVFLHRLRIADVPYAAFLGTQAGPAARSGKAPTEAAGGVAALTRVRESWEAQWTPSSDVALVERIVWGDTLQQVCERTLAKSLSEAATTGAAADVLMEAVLTASPEAIARALDTCDALASHDDDLASLARACRALSGLVSYGSSREHSKVGQSAIPALCEKTFARAVLRVHTACQGNDIAVAPAREALRTLHEVALAQPGVDGEAWFRTARDLVDSYSVHPTTSGLACGLLYLAQRLDEAEVSRLVTQRLSNVLEPEASAAFLAGFFEVNALVLLKSRPVVQALDSFLVGIDRDHFKDALPMLRRAFGGLSAVERRYLLENLLALRNLGAKAQVAAQVIAEKDKEKLKSMSNEMAKVMDDLDDLL